MGREPGCQRDGRPDRLPLFDPVWADADFRIVFARNKTDDHSGYALCLESLLGVLALEDKDYLYRHRSDRAAVVCEILRYAPPHAAIIDATVSAHGSGGGQGSNTGGDAGPGTGAGCGGGAWQGGAR